MRPLLFATLAAAALVSTSAHASGGNVLSIMKGDHTIDALAKNLMQRFKFNLHEGYYRTANTPSPKLLSGTVVRCKVAPISADLDLIEICGDAQPVIVRLDKDGNGDVFIVVTTKWARLDTHETFATTSEEWLGKVASDGGKLLLVGESLAGFERLERP